MTQKCNRFRSNAEFSYNMAEKAENLDLKKSSQQDNFYLFSKVFGRNYIEEDILRLEENCRIDGTGLLLPFILSPEERLEYFSQLKKISNLLQAQKFTTKIKTNSPKLSDLFFLN